MNTRYIVEYRVNSHEPDSDVPWVDKLNCFSIEDARDSLEWNRKNIKTTTITLKPVTWRIRKITEEVIPA